MGGKDQLSSTGIVFVTPEYNHGTSGALKNAIDFLYREWNNKAAGFVSYGGGGGARAVEHLRLVMGEIKIADVRAQVAALVAQRLRKLHYVQARDHTTSASVHAMFDEVEAWSGALKPLAGEVRESISSQGFTRRNRIKPEQ